MESQKYVRTFRVKLIVRTSTKAVANLTFILENKCFLYRCATSSTLLIEKPWLHPKKIECTYLRVARLEGPSGKIDAMYLLL